MAPASVWVEFFPTSVEDAEAVRGSEEWHVVKGQAQAQALAARLAQLLATPDEPA